MQPTVDQHEDLEDDQDLPGDQTPRAYPQDNSPASNSEDTSVAPGLIAATVIGAAAAAILYKRYGSRRDGPVEPVHVDPQTSPGLLNANSPTASFNTIASSIHGSMTVPHDSMGFSTNGNATDVLLSNTMSLRDARVESEAIAFSTEGPFTTSPHLQAESVSSGEPVSIYEISLMSRSQSSANSADRANLDTDIMSHASSQTNSFHNIASTGETTSDLLDSSFYRSNQAAYDIYARSIASSDSSGSRDYQHVTSHQYNDAETASLFSYGGSSVDSFPADSISQLPDNYVLHAGANYTQFHLPSVPGHTPAASEYSVISLRSAETDA